MLLCVVVLFLLCWGPRFILEILMKIGAFKYTVSSTNSSFITNFSNIKNYNEKTIRTR